MDTLSRVTACIRLEMALQELAKPVLHIPKEAPVATVDSKKMLLHNFSQLQSEEFLTKICIYYGVSRYRLALAVWGNTHQAKWHPLRQATIEQIAKGLTIIQEQRKEGILQ